MSQMFVTGAVPIFIAQGIVPGTSPSLLGWCEKMPRISIKPSFQDVFMDLGGQTVPSDALYSGEQGLISADIIRFNESTYQYIASKAVTGVLGGAHARGYNDPGEIATLMVQEGVAYHLWLPFYYNAKTSMGLGTTMPNGYHFFSCFLENDDLDQLGTAPRKLNLVWRALRTLDLTVSNSYGAGRFSLFNNDCSAVLNIPLS